MFNFCFSFTYSVLQIAQGLLIHPYQTMQSLVEEKVFTWMSLLPAFLLAIITVLWKYLLVPVVRVVFSCSTSNFFACDYLVFFSNWLTFFFVFWQVILIYLLFRFRLVWRSKILSET